MPDIQDLFVVLDDVALEAGRIELAPDPAIGLAIAALGGRADRSEALSAIDAQIVRVRTMRRALLFDLVADHDPVAARKHVSSIGCRLHGLAAALQLQGGELDSAREHLIRGMACDPEDDDIRFRFVELYLKTGAYADALAILVSTCERHPGDPLLDLHQTFRLGLDLQRAGAVDVADTAYSRVIDRDRDGRLLAALACLQRENVARGVTQSPPPAALEAKYAHVVTLAKDGSLQVAARIALELLSWFPDHPVCWFLVGYERLLTAQAGRIDADGVQEVTPMTLDRSVYNEVVAAKQALRLATALDHSFVEAFRNLGLCALLLDHPAEALAAAERGVQLAPNDATLVANLAVSQHAAGDVDGARRTARAALRMDPADRVALSLLARLER